MYFDSNQPAREQNPSVKTHIFFSFVFCGFVQRPSLSLEAALFIVIHSLVFFLSNFALVQYLTIFLPQVT